MYSRVNLPKIQKRKPLAQSCPYAWIVSKSQEEKTRYKINRIYHSLRNICDFLLIFVHNRWKINSLNRF